MERVAIVGGGTGATMLANSLDKRKFDVTVLSASAEHVFQPALLYVAFTNANPNISRDERKLLASSVRFEHDRVAKVDLRNRLISMESGASHGYDYVVLATGVKADVTEIPGLAEINAQFGDYHTSVAQAQKLWRSLDAFRGGTVVLGQASAICKCPPSPIEGILLVDRLLRERGLRAKSRLVFFSPYPRAYPAEPMNEILGPILAEREIEVMTIFDLDRIDSQTRTMFSIEGDEIHYDLPIVIPPFVGAEIVYDPPEVADPDRFIVADKETLRVKGFHDAFAIGDGTTIPTSKAGVAAHLEAKVVAKQLEGIAARFDGRTNCPVDLGDGRGTFVIGSFDAPVQKCRPNRLNHFFKAMMGRIYWLSLRGTLEPVFEAYFALTKPRKA